MSEKLLGSEFKRWERIDSVIYDMTKISSSQHQGVVGSLYERSGIVLGDLVNPRWKNRDKAMVLLDLKR